MLNPGRDEHGDFITPEDRGVADLSVLLDQYKASLIESGVDDILALADVAAAADRVSHRGRVTDFDDLDDALARLRLVLAGEEEA